MHPTVHADYGVFQMKILLKIMLDAVAGLLAPAPQMRY